MLTYNPDNNLVGQEPKKEVKKKPTGILKELVKLKRYFMDLDGVELIEDENGGLVEWEEVEKIIKKYS